MASAIIHLAVAKKLENELNIKNKKDYYLGSIAPDVAKQVGETKDKSHFIINTREDIPNIEVFTNKYPNFKNNDFDLGYFIHLYTDKLWFNEFLDAITTGNSIKLLDGTVLNRSPEEIERMIYSDYTNLNVKIIEKYDMDLSLFYEDFNIPNTNIEEIPKEKLDILINKMGIIIENTQETKSYTFDSESVEEFIDDCAKRTLEEIKKY